MSATTHRASLGALMNHMTEATGCVFALVEMRGAFRAARPFVLAGEFDGPEAVFARGDVRDVRLAERRSATFVLDGRAHHVVGVGTGPTATMLVASRPVPLPADLPTVAARTAWLAGVQLRAHRTEIAESRLADTRTRLREAAFRLLCAGHASAAQQVVGSLRRELPDPVRVCVLEGIPQQLRERHRGRPEILDEGIWAFRATVRRDAVVLLAPAADKGALSDLVSRLAASTGCLVGMSEVVPLRATGTGYEQALHALYAARDQAAGHLQFESRSQIAQLLGPAADSWAHTLLEPLLTYEPPRRTAADTTELLRTARVWLRLAQHAPRNLGVHRNTVRERLRLVAELLGADLNRVADQAIVSLALRVHESGNGEAPARRAGTHTPLESLLDSPQALQWALSQLRPFLGSHSDVGMDTVRAWLAHDACVVPTAAELGLSVSAARKRLLRVSRDLGRSLLELPGTRHDLWFALLIHDRAEARINGTPDAMPPVPGLTGRSAAAAPDDLAGSRSG
ncbi:helix-turn-helix domain-containing protein [Streptodolium elevatio]